MSEFLKLLIPYLIRSFLPINPFYTNFLVETKDFTNLEVSSGITPFYFYSSIFAMLFFKPIIENLGLTLTSVFITSFHFINMIIFLNLKKRSFKIASLTYFVAGFIFTFDVMYRFYVGETNTSQKKVESKYSYMSLLKTITNSSSSVVGQEIVNKTGFYEINIHISIAFLFISLLMSIYRALTQSQSINISNIDMMDSISNSNTTAFCAFLASCIAGSYCIYTKLFMNSIFRDKDRADDDKSTNLEKSKSKLLDSLYYVLYLPVQLIANIFIFLVTLIFPKYKGEGNAQKRFLTGNFDAISNVSCVELSYLIVLYSSTDYKEYNYIFLLFLAISTLFLMINSKHKNMVYLMYFLNGVFSRSCGAITKSFLKGKNGENNLVLLAYFVECLLHIIVNLICKNYKINTVSKTKAYGYIGVLTFLGIILCKVIE